jgi:hypothetical protein
LTKWPLCAPAGRWLYDTIAASAPEVARRADRFGRGRTPACVSDHYHRRGQHLSLAVPDPVLDFPILSELRAEGVTDYFAVPLVFTDGTIHVATWTTREPRGFTDEQIAGIEAIVTPLARVAEIRALRRTASTLLDTYVGQDAGERILAGHIRRGDIEEIHAAIWLSDMRGFTALADSLPPRVMIDLRLPDPERDQACHPDYESVHSAGLGRVVN